MTELEATLISIVSAIGPAHGLAIAEEAEERLGRRIGVGSLYKALHRLEIRGYLDAQWEKRSTEPKHRGPDRRYYQLTGTGARALADFQLNFAKALKLQLRTAR